MKRKAKDEKSESGKSSAVLSTKSPTGEDEDSVSPQKRKGTIWKILFPDKKSEDDACELERLVCSQVETQISKDPKVIKSYKELKLFEESDESQEMTKSEYTKKKNRISAQLSRERREAILHSLINVCIQNIKAKKELDADIDEVREVLKGTLCDGCSANIKGATWQNAKPSTLGLKPAGAAQSKEKRPNPGIVISRPGTWGLLMSFAVIACVLSVAFLDFNKTERGISGVPASENLMNARYLREDSSDEKMMGHILSLASEEESATVPDVYINELIRWVQSNDLIADTCKQFKFGV